MNIDIAGLFKKYKTIIIWSLISAVLSAVLIMLVILPQLVLVRQTDQDLKKNQQKIEAFKKKISDLQSIDENEYKDDLGVTLVSLPAEKDLPAALDQIQILLAKNKLQLSNISFDSSPVSDAASSTTQSFQIKMGVSGDSDSFKSFIGDLRSAPQIMKLSGLSITASSGGLSQNSVTLTAYYQAPPKSLGSVDQTISLLSGKDKDLIKTLSSNAQSIPIISSSQTTTQRGKSNPFQ